MTKKALRFFAKPFFYLDEKPRRALALEVSDTGVNSTCVPSVNIFLARNIFLLTSKRCLGAAPKPKSGATRPYIHK